ncbi:FAD-dependent oxidoreductase [Verrucomicrobium sp. BvORR106]|uniref:FAD-dependent oxidoreductase n=1 Tax=Verrucomicrobium sp. BvORR106 TaxID=1403819 RepID=UPI00056DED30|nr:FAD-dependent oxidoreductase [Verrucomicrobium sp. BvORR106]
MHRRFFVAALIAATALHPGLAQEPTAPPAATSTPPADAPAYDVVVYSGVPCGVAASVAAAREGAKTLLIEPTKEVGGLNTSGLNTAETEHMLKWTFGGVAQEAYQRMGWEYGRWNPVYYFESKVAAKVFHAMLDEAKVEVKYGVRVDKVEKEGATIKSITLSDGSKITAKTFVDAGYEGDLMARSGVSYTWGRESIEEYGESLAGIRLDKTPRKAATVDEKGNLLPGISGWAKDVTEGAADKKVMNYNWRLCLSNDPEQSVPFPQPKQYDRARYRVLENWIKEKTAANEPVKLLDIIDLYSHAPGRKDKKEVNNKQAAVISVGHFGGQFDYPDGDYATRDRIIADHTDYTLGMFHFLATDETVPETLRTETKQWGLAKDEFTNNDHWPYQPYVREARRMKGLYVVTQKDITEDRRKPDSIAMGSHFIDSHHVQRLALSPTEFVNEGRIWEEGQVYQIPFRAIQPKAEECTNLLVPGAASFSHVAFCTYRLESTWMKTGHAAGVAAARAALWNKTVQDLIIENLQERLRDQGQVIDFIEGQPEKFVKEQKKVTKK